tara:strand:+ start:19355 stop:20218 length:864 start_codon:yes stop_codon:yes gene_type:complete
VNFLVIGKGHWSKNYLNTIKSHPKANLASHISARHILEKTINPSFYLDEIIKNNKIQVIIISTLPSIQIEIVKALKEFKGQLILEKPLFTSSAEKSFYKSLNSLKSKRMLINHFHFFSNDFLKILNNLNKKTIKKIHIYDYGKGPYREFIEPIFDWGPHSLGIANYFLNDIHYEKILKEVNNIGEKWFIHLRDKSSIDIKILTGNGFDKKKREIIFYNNDNSKYFFKEDEKIFSSKPMYNLINTSIENIINTSNQNDEIFKIAFRSCLSLLNIKKLHKKQKLKDNCV